MSENRIPLLHFANVHFKILDFVAAAKVDYMKNWCWLFRSFQLEKKNESLKENQCFLCFWVVKIYFWKRGSLLCNIIQLIFFVTRFSGSTISLVMDWGCDLSEMVRSNIPPKTCTKKSIVFRWTSHKSLPILIFTTIGLELTQNEPDPKAFLQHLSRPLRWRNARLLYDSWFFQKLMTSFMVCLLQWFFIISKRGRQLHRHCHRAIRSSTLIILSSKLLSGLCCLVTSFWRKKSSPCQLCTIFLALVVHVQ